MLLRRGYAQPLTDRSRRGLSGSRRANSALTERRAGALCPGKKSSDFDKIEATIQNPAAGVSPISRPTSGSRMSGRFQRKAVPRTSERCLRSWRIHGTDQAISTSSCLPGADAADRASLERQARSHSGPSDHESARPTESPLNPHASTSSPTAPHTEPASVRTYSGPVLRPTCTPWRRPLAQRV